MNAQTDAPTLQDKLRGANAYQHYSEAIQRQLSVPVNMWMLMETADALDAAQAEIAKLREALRDAYTLSRERRWPLVQSVLERAATEAQP
jgi:hypothetical protein